MNHTSNVLVVEDDPAIGELIERRLSAKGYSVSIHTRMWSVVDSLAQYDIMILDLGLPNGDGRRLLQLWTERGIEWPILVISGSMDPAAMETLISDGAWNAFPKPFDMATVERVIDRYDSFRRLVDVSTEVAKLKRRVLYLAMTVVALGGTQILRPLLNLLLGG